VPKLSAVFLKVFLQILEGEFETGSFTEEVKVDGGIISLEFSSVGNDY